MALSLPASRATGAGSPPLTDERPWWPRRLPRSAAASVLGSGLVCSRGGRGRGRGGGRAGGVRTPPVSPAGSARGDLGPAGVRNRDAGPARLTSARSRPPSQARAFTPEQGRPPWLQCRGPVSMRAHTAHTGRPPGCQAPGHLPAGQGHGSLRLPLTPLPGLPAGRAAPLRLHTAQTRLQLEANSLMHRFSSSIRPGLLPATLRSESPSLKHSGWPLWARLWAGDLGVSQCPGGARGLVGDSPAREQRGPGRKFWIENVQDLGRPEKASGQPRGQGRLPRVILLVIPG